MLEELDILQTDAPVFQIRVSYEEQSEVLTISDDYSELPIYYLLNLAKEKQIEWLQTKQEEGAE